MKELDEVANPIITKMYGAAGGPDMSGGMPGGMPTQLEASSGPTIEEVD